MNKYEKLKEEYNQLIIESFSKNKSILIEAFVEYYGEKYRSIIEKRYNEISFAYYLDWETIDVVINEFIPQAENPKKYEIFQKFSDAFRNQNSFLSKLFKRKKKDSFLPDNYVGTTNPSILNIEYIKNSLLRLFQSPLPVSFNYGSIRHLDRIITFQILSLTESAIIHEINHAITRDYIAYIIEDERVTSAISKTGLSIDIASQSSDEKNLEELLNEKASEEITKIFKRRGGDFSAFCYDIPLEYAYEHNFYLVDEFYNLFKDYIKDARISDNKNTLVKRIGEDNYAAFLSLINSNYSTDLDQIAKNKQASTEQLKSLIAAMQKTANASSDISKEELERYYEELRQAGHTVTPISDLPTIDEKDVDLEIPRPR